MIESTLINAEAAQEIQNGAVLRGNLVIWTVYHSPSDRPDFYVARPHEIRKGGIDTAKEHLEARTLEELRVQLPEGLYRLDRQRHDEPQILETWL